MTSENILPRGSHYILASTLNPPEPCWLNTSLSGATMMPLLSSSRRLLTTSNKAQWVRLFSDEGPALSYVGRVKDKSKYTLTQQEPEVRRSERGSSTAAPLFFPLVLNMTVLRFTSNKILISLCLQYKLGKHRSNALELIQKAPIIEVSGERATCDGGGGALGHPLEYISLQRPGQVKSCIYCGLRFKRKDGSHH
jgi:NADH dehydrogenase (ubiquinone) Fe-S protein 6